MRRAREESEKKSHAKEHKKETKLPMWPVWRKPKILEFVILLAP
jgi:hypothetical protein